MTLYGGIEAGGTKFVCMVAGGPDDIRKEVRFPTLVPEVTLAQSVEFFQQQGKDNPISGLGIASFGPLDLNPASETFGSITTTPKPGWQHTPFSNILREALQVPVAIDTDVNAAAYGEYLWGAARREEPLVYLTIGTGIGGGVIVNGKPVHGLVHPEIGHMRIPHDWKADPFNGACPYHGDCFEGLACGVALNSRLGQPAENLPPDHPVWELEAGYIAAALVNLVVTISPRKIILGGGVMQQMGLFPLVRQKVQALLNYYIDSPAILKGIDQYIVPPGLGNRSGVLGAIALVKTMVEPQAPVE